MKRYIKYIAIIVSVILVAITVTACSINKNNTDNQTDTSSGKTSEVKTDAAQSDYFTERDLDPSYEEKDAKQLRPGNSGTAITEEGVYILSGKYEGGVTVDAGESAKVQLVLNNAEIRNICEIGR